MRVIKAVQAHHLDHFHAAEFARHRVNNTRAIGHRGGQIKRNTNGCRGGGLRGVGLSFVKGIEPQNLRKKIVGNVAIGDHLHHVERRRHPIELRNRGG